MFFFSSITLDVWGFDGDAVNVLENMRPADENLIYKYAILLGEKAFTPTKADLEVRHASSFMWFCLFCGTVCLTGH